MSVPLQRERSRLERLRLERLRLERLRQVRFEVRTAGIAVTAAAVMLALATGVAILATASTALAGVRSLVLLLLVWHAGALLLGSFRWVGLSSLPVLGAVMIEAGFSDAPSWIRSIILGVLWFVTMEVSWEAIDRRSGADYTTQATMRRVQEVLLVVGISLGIGLVAVATTSLAPARSVLLQAVVLGGLLLAFTTMITRIRSSA